MGSPDGCFPRTNGAPRRRAGQRLVCSGLAREFGIGAHARAFAETGVDAEVLPRLTARTCGDRRPRRGSPGPRKLVDAIAALQAQGTPAPSADEPAAWHAARPRGAERRELTVMFVDLVGSTALSQRLDPEEMGETFIRIRMSSPGP